MQKLFFRVLNTPVAARSPDVAKAFREVPYLNSSLFEKSRLERQASISNLEDHLTLPLAPRSVLRAVTPKKADAPQALVYLLRFLDAYDFASDPATDPADGADPDQPRPDTAAPRPLISAAVLGLIFEKINGYQDGSFYTPGFVTMYIARHTLRRAVVRHFQRRDAAGTLADVTTVEELADRLRPQDRLADARYFNQLTVCDPAVGSGHFLVSALNELLACKAALGLLLEGTEPTPDGKPPRKLPYHLHVLHDELVVTDYDDQPFPYRVGSYDPATGARTVGQAHTALQRALFREKRALMEHALFGVDLNPNSVRICQLRLWIELLKHAYYKPETQHLELETLPNLELNIRTGNSLLSRFALAEDLTDVFRRQGSSLRAYRDAVSAYFSASGTQAKTDLMGLLTRYRDTFREVIHRRDPLRLKISRTRGERDKLEGQGGLFPETPKQREAREWEIRRMTLLLEQQEAELTAREQGALFRDAFEWRFEFPEILDEKGAFRGFDVVVGNPPYGAVQEQAMKKYLLKTSAVSQGRIDLYEVFIEKAYQLLRREGQLGFIVPTPVLTNLYGVKLRELLLNEMTFKEIISFKYDVFDLPTVHTCILLLENTPDASEAVTVRNGVTSPEALTFQEVGYTLSQAELASGRALTINLFSTEKETASIIEQMQENSDALGNLCYLRQCIKTGNDSLYVKEYDVPPGEPWKPTLRGRSIDRYTPASSNLYLNYGPWLARNWNNRTFYETEKIVIRETGARLTATLDTENHYLLSSLYAIYRKGTTEVDHHFLLGVINSQLATYFIQKTAFELAEGAFTKVRTNQLAKLPIPRATPEQQAEIAGWVQQVLTAKAADPAADPTELEARIDGAVAALYGLPAPPVVA